MEYIKKFDCLDKLDAYVRFHREETGLLFSSNSEKKTAWIEVELQIFRELEDADR